MATSNHKTRFRFGMRSLLVLVTLVCLLLTMLSQPLFEAQKQRQMVAKLQNLGADISTFGTVLRPPSVSRAILGRFGNEYDRDFLYAVDLSSSSITDSDLQPLTQLPHLHHLNLSGTKITNSGLDTIAACTNLYELDLSETQVTDAGIQKLKKLKKLASLNTVDTAVTYPALDELDSCLPWANSAEQRAIAEVQAFGAQAPAVPRLWEDPTSLHLPVVQGGEELAGGLIILGMNKMLRLGRSEISHLAYVKSLNYLNIHDVIIEPGSFVDVHFIPNLTTLEIWHVDISDVDLRHLARQANLETLHIHNNQKITDAGIVELAKLNKLEKLQVSQCNGVTSASIDYLREQLPGCEISFLDMAAAQANGERD